MSFFQIHQHKYSKFFPRKLRFEKILKFAFPLFCWCVQVNFVNQQQVLKLVDFVEFTTRCGFKLYTCFDIQNLILASAQVPFQNWDLAVKILRRLILYLYLDRYPLGQPISMIDSCLSFNFIGRVEFLFMIYYPLCRCKGKELRSLRLGGPQRSQSWLCLRSFWRRFGLIYSRFHFNHRWTIAFYTDINLILAR